MRAYTHTHTHTQQTKARGGANKVSIEQALFQLKQKVILALNKLADRDTYQIGADELEKTAQCLTPEGLPAFLSCILDTDSEQKPAVRKHCIRLMGVLTRSHKPLIGPHVRKMVSSIVKRLKDSDSSVRDACVETIGILAMELGDNSGVGLDGDGLFVTLVKPLFEALGEQNKHVQLASALCLARVIDNTPDPPPSILQRMLNRTIKLLRNPHFMAKPAVIELNRSIIQAGGASKESVLSAAVASIQEALKNSDWATRKAASLALAEIASTCGSFLGPFRVSCIRTLEACRFDKVKPVRDTVLQAINCWKSLPGPDDPQHSETGSSVKESFCAGDYSDVTSVSGFGSKRLVSKKVGAEFIRRQSPSSMAKVCQTYKENPSYAKPDDWHIEIAIPEIQRKSLSDFSKEESEGSSVTKTTERISADVSSMQDIAYEYTTIDDKQDYSSASNILANNYRTKKLTVSQECLDMSSLHKLGGNCQKHLTEDTGCSEDVHPVAIEDCKSLNSTVTESSPQNTFRCCQQTACEMIYIRKQLLEIENRQSSLMDMLQVLATSTTESLSLITSKLLALESSVDRISRDIMHKERYHHLVGPHQTKKNDIIASPRLSTCTPRTSFDAYSKQSSLLIRKKSEFLEGKEIGRIIPNDPLKQDTEKWIDPRLRLAGNYSRNDTQKCPGRAAQKMDTIQIESSDSNCSSIWTTDAGRTILPGKPILWRRMRSFLREGDIDSAYAEALLSGDDHVLTELINSTGPVLESLSQNTVNDVLRTLAAFILEQRLVNLVLPWFQQVVELSSIHGPDYVVPSMKAKRELISAIQKAVNMEFSSMDKKSISQISMKLQRIWGKST